MYNKIYIFYKFKTVNILFDHTNLLYYFGVLLSTAEYSVNTFSLLKKCASTMDIKTELKNFAKFHVCMGVGIRKMTKSG